MDIWFSKGFMNVSCKHNFFPFLSFVSANLRFFLECGEEKGINIAFRELGRKEILKKY